MKVCRIEEMRDLDRKAVKEYAIDEILLMENAALAAYSVLENEVGIRGTRFLILCGVGNNGGDGLALARKILSSDGMVDVCILGDPESFKGAAKKNFKIASTLPMSMKRLNAVKKLTPLLDRNDIVIDAIFGTGLTREVDGIYREVIRMLNREARFVLSLDIPSGINGNNGRVMGSAVWADCTVTFGLPKLGNLLYPGFTYGGTLYVSHISFPPALTEQDSLRVEVNIPSLLPERKEDGHKGEFGQCLFIAGAANYFGAPYFSALSFLKAGGGYSRLAAPLSVTPYIAGKGSEIVFLPQAETETGSISLSNKNALIDISTQMDFVVIGPGLTLNEETQELVRQLVEAIKKPVLIDGDGLTAVSKDMGLIKKRTHPTILTPHLGEMSRITGIPVVEIKKDPAAILQQESQKLKAAIVLKGAHSLIGFPEGKVVINTSGNSGMATAGAGDVLAGTIAAMFGLGLDLNEAVQTGVFMHGFSGDIAASEKGEDGIIAQDILDSLPAALKSYRESYGEIIENHYESLMIV